MNINSLVLAIAVLSAPLAASGAPVHGLAMHGEPKYKPGFTHFDYVNPEAPKGGTARLASIGTFDSLNPFILKGIAPTGVGMTFDSLTTASSDEPFTRYGLLAETIETPDDRSWVLFELRPEARFHDGSSVTPEDVIFTFETMKTSGHPYYRTYYKTVEKVEKVGARGVKFTFGDTLNRELPLIIGEMAVLSKKFFEATSFDKTTLTPLLGSGPYRIAKVEPGRSVTYERNPDYWGKELPVNRGRHNFDAIRYDYYRDITVAVEAFKAGEYDFRVENTARIWATGYNFPPVSEGRVTKVAIPHSNPTGMQGYFMNTRRPFFKDPLVRRALIYGFDFEWSNKNLFNSAYTRTSSYFSNSDLASSGLPEDEELAILEKFRDKLPPELFTETYEVPATDGSGNLRRNLRNALGLLKRAGWEIDKKTKLLTNVGTGETFSFEILLVNPSFERITLPYAKNLKKLGIEATVRTIHPTQYQNRMDGFDFDMTVDVIGQSLSPGNEQRDFWHSANANVPGSRNVAGVSDPVVDELVELVISATDRESLVARTRALDRVLLWSNYVVPHWHIRNYRTIFWNKFGRPATNPPYDLAFDSWWLMGEAGKRE